MGRATKGHQSPPGRKRMHRISVKIGVEMGRPRHIFETACERRRIENYQVKALGGAGQKRSGIALEQIHAINRIAVEFDIAPRPSECTGRGVNRRDLSRAPGQSVEREATAITAGVEDTLATSKVTQ